MSRLLCSVLLVFVLTPCSFGITVTDPLGDQIPDFGGPLLDLVGITIDSTSSALQFTLTLAAGTSAANVQELGGVIEIDTDRNEATGRPSHLEDFGLIPSYQGVDYYLEMFPFSSEVWLSYVDSGSGMESTWPVQNLVRTSNSVVLTAPLVNSPELEGVYLPGNQFALIAMLGNNYGPTDRAPEGETPYLITIPEPASLALLALSAGSCLLRRSGTYRQSRRYSIIAT